MVDHSEQSKHVTDQSCNRVHRTQLSSIIESTANIHDKGRTINDIRNCAKLSVNLSFEKCLIVENENGNSEKYFKVPASSIN